MGNQLYWMPRPWNVFTDACDDAAGGVLGTDLPQAQNLYINEKEVLAVILAADRWAPFWTNKRIFID